MAKDCILAIDQSTQGTKALVIDGNGKLVARADRAHRQIVNEAGWVSHDPREIARNLVGSCADALAKAGVDPSRVAGVGISNQRETTVAWRRSTGEPVCDAIVWQCARAKGICERIARVQGNSELVYAHSGLALSPYYPASKMAWILENVPEAREAAGEGDLCLGTVDAWAVWSLTGGATFACDYSNASRTQLFDVQELAWSPELCELFGIEEAWLPELYASDACFGMTDLDGLLPAPVPIHAVLGDSHAALFGQGCLAPGMAKATLGTGSSAMMNVGEKLVLNASGLSSSLAWKRGGVTEHVLEGNVNYAGAVVTWLKDDVDLIESPSEATELCFAANPASKAYLVPAFTGLGAPWWSTDAKASILGMDRTCGRAEIVRAGVESIAYQIFDVVDAMRRDSGSELTELRVDGGPTRNDYLMQFLADLLGCPVVAAGNDEMSGLGAGWLCGISLGLYGEDVVRSTPPRASWEPAIGEDVRARRVEGWHRAVGATLAYARKG